MHIKRTACIAALIAVLTMLMALNLSCISDEVLRPIGDGTYQDLMIALGGTPYHYDKVDDSIPDEDATVVYKASGITIFFTDTYIFPALSWEENIESLLITFRYQRQGLYGTDIKPALYINETLYFGTEINIPTTSVEWVAVTECFATSPDTGLAWTTNEVNNSEFGISIRGASGTATECTQVTVRVEYDLR